MPIVDALAENWQFLLGSGFVGGSLLGYAVKHLLDERSAHRAGKRKFAEKVTEHISELAGEYYWLLANHASVVAGQLEDYLHLRTSYLLVQWSDHQELKRHLEEIADEAANSSFVYFARVISLFRDFQFERGSTYLLTEHWAGETIKKLYNRFIEAAGRIDKYGEIMRVLAERSNQDGATSRSRAWLVFSKAISDGELRAVQKEYRDWLLKASDDVRRAADSLRACSELLNRQLAQLYADWYKGRIDDQLPRAAVLRDSFSPDARRVIQRTQFEATLLQPVRESYPTVPTKDQQTKPRPTAAEREVTEDQAGGTGPARQGAQGVPAAGTAEERKNLPHHPKTVDRSTEGR